MALVWFDAHADLNTPESSPSGHFHGMPLRTLLGEGNASLLQHCFSFLKPEQLFLMGVRDLDLVEQDYIRDREIATFSTHCSATELTQAIRARGFERIYLHFDLDVLEPAEFDNRIFQVDQGMPLQTALSLVENLTREFEVVGSSLLEYGGERESSYKPFLEELAALLLK